MTDFLERRIRAAAQGEVADAQTRLDTNLRALVDQLHGGPPAPRSDQYHMVEGKLARAIAEPTRRRFARS